MQTLSAGKHAPDFTLPLIDGSSFSLSQALRKGPVVLAFFKISCPVCQYAFPFIERLYQSLDGKAVTVIGISQDDADNTRLFMREFGVTFPVALDSSSSGYKVSNAYGLTNVPTILEIDPTGTVQVSSVGWSKRDLESIHQHLSSDASAAAASLFKPAEQVSDFRPG